MVTVFNSMTFALKVTPFSVKSLSEASVAVDRFKVSGSCPSPVSGAILSTAHCVLYSKSPRRPAAFDLGLP